jgi:uncharacterized iron-regulated membrane protein
LLTGESVSSWRRWVEHPQKLWLRKAVFQVHLWSGVALGLYIFFISLTGSVLVYRNELLFAAMPQSVGMFDASPGTSYELVMLLIDLHDNLLAGEAGRAINGVAAIAVLLVVFSGFFIWWPGLRRWQKSMTLRGNVGWKRLTWDLHSAVGVWTAAFSVIFAASGVYLCFPQVFHRAAEWLQPLTADNAGQRFVDKFLYWLAFLHFGRINGIGLPCSGPGLCDQATKAAWAFAGLAPAAMFVTGSIMWWNRVLRRWLKRVRFG